MHVVNYKIRRSLVSLSQPQMEKGTPPDLHTFFKGSYNIIIVIIITTKKCRKTTPMKILHKKVILQKNCKKNLREKVKKN